MQRSTERKTGREAKKHGDEWRKRGAETHGEAMTLSEGSEKQREITRLEEAKRRQIVGPLVV